MRRKTHDEFVREVYELVGDEYTFLGVYNGNQTKIEIRHNCEKCENNIYSVSPSNFLKGKRCPLCRGGFKKDTAQYSKEVLNKTNGEFSLIGEYLNSKEKVKIKHEICGRTFEIKPTVFLSNKYCSLCKKEQHTLKVTKSNEQFLKEVYGLVGDEYEFLDEYKTTATKIRVIHNKCGFIYKVKPNGFLTGSRCLKCSGSLQKNSEYLAEEVYKITKGEYSFIGEYERSNIECLFVHNECGHEFMMKPTVFTSTGRRCPKCTEVERAKKRTKTNSDFVKEIFDLTGSECTFLEDYKKSDVKIMVSHNKCGYKYMVSPNDFLNGARCYNCWSIRRSEIRMKDPDDFEKEFNIASMGKYELMSRYVSSKEKVKVRHLTCGTTYLVKPSNFMSGKRCPCCFARNIQKSTDDFKEDVEKLVGDEYKVVGEYTKSKYEIDMIHNRCGRAFSIRPNSFLSGKRCKKCSFEDMGLAKMKTHEKFCREVDELGGGKYELIGTYKGDKHKIAMRHRECNREYQVVPSSFIQGSRCPMCRLSKGEVEVAAVLDRFDVNYKSQYSISDCRNVLPLPFDFAILGDDDEELLLIEYDGEQHFRPVTGLYPKEEGEKIFGLQKKRDSIKDEYCYNNSIPLLRIPYWDIDDIERIVFDKLIEIEIIKEVAI